MVHSIACSETAIDGKKHDRRGVSQTVKVHVFMYTLSLSALACSVIFDGTTHVCEAMVTVLRYVDETWCIQQRVAKLLLMAKSMTGEELARQLIVTLSTELAIQLCNC